MFVVAIRNTIAPAAELRWAEAILMSLVALAASIPAIAVLYLVKSALGVNLMFGPSPLHDLVYILFL